MTMKNKEQDTQHLNSKKRQIYHNKTENNEKTSCKN